MTLDGYALTGLFVVMFGFLAFSAWIFEQAEPDPLTPDRRHQAHPIGDYRPTPRSGPEQVEVPILDGTRIPVQGRSSVPDKTHPATSGATTYAVDHGPARSSLRGSPVADLPPESASAG